MRSHFLTKNAFLSEDLMRSNSVQFVRSKYQYFHRVVGMRALFGPTQIHNTDTVQYDSSAKNRMLPGKQPFF
jgi:hypothetical protein